MNKMKKMHNELENLLKRARYMQEGYYYEFYGTWEIWKKKLDFVRYFFQEQEIFISESCFI